MFQLEVTKRFYASHGLYDFRGEDELIHEHHWKVVVFAKAETLDISGCAIDFHEVDHLLNKVLSRFQGACFNDHAPFDVLSPSAENIAKYLHEELNLSLKSNLAAIFRVMVCEDEEHCASYESH